jgi:secretion/DNA translocation related TadE-like protein
LLLAMLAQLVLVLTVVVARQHQVDAAADLAALSAAHRLQDRGPACPAARVVTEAHEATLTSCVVDGDDVSVEVTARMALPLGLSVDLRGRARAGP